MRSLRGIVSVIAGLLCLLGGATSAWAQFTSDTNYGGADFIPPDGATIAGSHTNIGLFHILPGTTVYVEPWDGVQYGSVVIDAQTVLIEGDLVAIGAGELGGLPTLGPTPSGDGLPGEGPGAGGGGERGNYVGSSGGGGAGYGGTGGVGGDGENMPGAGGPVYGDAMTVSTEMGSGGGAGGAHAQPGFPSSCPGCYWGGEGGRGGGAITLNASVDLTISGSVLADGEDGWMPIPMAPLAPGSYGGGGGAGSGGGILISTGNGVVTGTLSVAGGIGGDAGMNYSGIAGGGGGGGGRIKVIGSVNTVMATLTAAGGAAGFNGSSATPPNQPGLDGTIFTFNSVDPVATPIPPSIDFGDIPVTSTAGPMTLTILNAGGANLIVTNVMLTGSPMYTMVGPPPVLPATLLPAQTVSVQVEYTPTTQATHNATFTIDSNDPFFPVLTVPVTGTGVLPGFAVSPTILDFGSVEANTASPTLMFNISNNGSGTVMLTGAMTGGAGIAEFDIVDLPMTTPMSMVPGTVIPVSVTYLPLDLGPDSGTITLTSNDPMNPTVVVTLDGIGVAGELTPIPSPLDFGGWPVGAGSDPEVLTLQNTGTDDVTINSFGISGPSAAAFIPTAPPSLPVVLAPGASELVEITFLPGMVGAHSGTITVGSDVPGMPMLNIPVIGEGFTAMLSVMPTSLDFGDVQVGTISEPLTVTLENSGAAELTLVSAQLGGASPGSFSHDFPTVGYIVPAGMSVMVQVRFGPGTTGLVAGTLTFISDVPGAPLSTVGLVGNGVIGAVNGTDAGTMMPTDPPIASTCLCRVGRASMSPVGWALPLTLLVLGAVVVRRRRRRS